MPVQDSSPPLRCCREAGLSARPPHAARGHLLFHLHMDGWSGSPSQNILLFRVIAKVSLTANSYYEVLLTIITANFFASFLKQILSHDPLEA